MNHTDRTGLYLLVIIVMLVVWGDSDEHQQIQDDIAELRQLVLDRTVGPEDEEPKFYPCENTDEEYWSCGGKITEEEEVVAPMHPTIYMPEFCRKNLPMATDRDRAIIRQCLDIYTKQVEEINKHE